MPVPRKSLPAVLTASTTPDSKLYINTNSIANNLIFKIWINNNLEHLVRDYGQVIKNKTALYEDEKNEDLNLSWLEFGVQKRVFAYFEEKSLNTSDQYLYDTFGEDLIKEVSKVLLTKVQDSNVKSSQV